MLELARRLAWRAFPGAMANRAVRWNLEVERRAGPAEPVGEVIAGPFAGLKYPDSVTGKVTSPRLKRSGAYERAVAPVVAAELEREPALFVDVGAADGYYAVSAARLGVPTLAYESSSIQRETLHRVARANSAELEIRRHCRHLPALPSGSLMLMDVEGAEIDLLGGRAPQRLAASTIVVELHEMFSPGVTDALVAGFAKTHSSEIVEGDVEPGRQGGKPVWGVFRPRS